MAVRSEREKSKMQEKYQIILAQMLREEDNRYCVDCDAKSNWKETTSYLLRLHLFFLYCFFD